MVNMVYQVIRFKYSDSINIYDNKRRDIRENENIEE